MILNTCNFIKRIEQVLVELDISAIEDYVIIIIITVSLNCHPTSRNVQGAGIPTYVWCTLMTHHSRMLYLLHSSPTSSTVPYCT